MEKFIPYYPNLNGVDGQEIIYNLEEFNTLQLSEQMESIGGPGTYYKHQITVSRLMTMVDRLFAIHEPGSGKTCMFVGWDEFLKDNSAVIDHIYFVTAASLIVSSKMQMLCKCTNKTYITENIINSKDSTQRLTNITLSLKKWYNVLTYNDLAKLVIGKTSEELKNEFSGKAFNIDEVDNLNVNKADNDIINFHFDVKKIDDDGTINSKSDYIQFWRLFHSIERSKVIIATATPIKNNSYELFILCNLLLPSDKQINIFNLSQIVKDDIREYDYKNLKYFEPYFSNLFSYVAQGYTGAYPRYNGEKLNRKYLYPTPFVNEGDIIIFNTDKAEWSDNPDFINKTYESQIIVYKIEMFNNQAETFYEERLKNQSLFTNEELISYYVDDNMVFGTDAIVTKNFFQSEENIRRSASKFAFIFKNEQKMWEETNGKPGFAFIYLTKTNAGGVRLAENLTQNGYEEFDVRTTGGGSISVCGSVSLTSLNIAPKKRFSFITSEIGENERDKILSFCSSYQNRNGEYVQMLIGSEVLAVGVNVGNAVRYYRFGPEWNEAREKQTRDRVFRADSHNHIKNDIINELKRKDEYTDQIPDIPVDFYNMCSYCRYYFIDTRSIINGIDDKISNGRIISKYITHFVGFPTGNLNLPIYDDGNGLTHDKYNLDYYNMDEIIRRIKNKDKFIISFTNILYIVDINIIKDYCLLITEDGFYNKEKTIGEYNDHYYLFYNNELHSIKMKLMSIDEIIYETSEKKSLSAKKFLRYAKQYASDCLINYNRNMKKKSYDGSADCDFGRCQYKCAIDVKNSINPLHHKSNSKFYDNFEILYSKGIIDECKNEIVKIVFENKSIFIDELYKILLLRYRDTFIYEAIYLILYEKTPYRDDFGFLIYITYNNTSLFLKREYPIEIENDDLGEYANKLIGIDSDISFHVDFTKDNQVIDNIRNYRLTGNQIDLKNIYKLLNSIIYKKIVLNFIEESISRLIEGKGNQIDNIIYHIYESNIFNIKNNNIIYYVHNILERLSSNTQFSKVNSYIKMTSTFKKYIGNNEWVVIDNKEEEKVISEDAKKQVNEKIKNAMKINIRGQILESKIFMYYIDGNYFILDSRMKNNNGKNIDTKIEENILYQISNYFVEEFGLDPIDYQVDKKILIRNLIEYFSKLGLIYYFTVKID